LSNARTAAMPGMVYFCLRETHIRICIRVTAVWVLGPLGCNFGVALCFLMHAARSIYIYIGTHKIDNPHLAVLFLSGWFVHEILEEPGFGKGAADAPSHGQDSDG
jgi:hypothetical protein